MTINKVLTNVTWWRLTSLQTRQIKWPIEQHPNAPTQTLRHANNQILQIAHRRDRMREPIDMRRRFRQTHDIVQLGTGKLDAHILDQGAAARACEQRLREREVVFGLYEEEGFVQHGVGDGVEAVVDEAEGVEIALQCECRDLDEQLVGEVEEVPRADCGVANRHEIRGSWGSGVSKMS